LNADPATVDRTLRSPRRCPDLGSAIPAPDTRRAARDAPSHSWRWHVRCCSRSAWPRCGSTFDTRSAWWPRRRAWPRCWSPPSRSGSAPPHPGRPGQRRRPRARAVAQRAVPPARHPPDPGRSI